MMRFFRLVVLLLPILFLNTNLLAGWCPDSSLPVNIRVSRSDVDYSSVCIFNQRGSFIFSNSQPVDFEEDSLENLYGLSTKDYCALPAADRAPRYDGLWSGCLSKRSLFVNRSNVITFSVCTSNGIGGCLKDFVWDRNYYAEIQNDRGSFLRLFNYRLKGIGTSFSANCSVSNSQSSSADQCNGNFTTDFLVPKSMDEIRRLLVETENLRKESEALTEEAKADIEEALKAIDAIGNKTWDQLTYPELVHFADAVTLLHTYKDSANSSLAAIAKKLDEIKTRLVTTQETAVRELLQLGVDVKSEQTYKDVVDFDIKKIKLPDAPGTSALEERDNVFKLLADKALPLLQDAWTKQNRVEFLRVSADWSSKNQSLMEYYRPRFVSSPAELQAFIAETKRVEDLIYGDAAAGSSGVLDRSGWFKDTHVDAITIDVLEKLISAYPKDKALQAVKDALNRKTMGKSQGAPDANTVRMIVGLSAWVHAFQQLVIILNEAKAAGFVPPPGAPPKPGVTYAGLSWEELIRLEVLRTRDMLVEVKQLIEAGIDTYVSTSPISPIVSLCVFTTGFKSCDTRVGTKEEDGLIRIFGLFDVLGAKVGSKVAGVLLNKLKVDAALRPVVQFFDEVWSKVVDRLKPGFKSRNLARALMEIRDLTPNQVLALTRAIEDIGLKAEEEMLRYLDVLKVAKGNRVSPIKYLPPGYITEHLKKFDGGASYLVKKSVITDYGDKLLGWPDGQFVMSSTEMDSLLKKTSGDLALIEQELGIPPGSWTDSIIVRIDISDPKALNLRMPTGNEIGANSHWIPGGRLPGGHVEAVVDRIPLGKYTLREWKDRI